LLTSSVIAQLLIAQYQRHTAC